MSIYFIKSVFKLLIGQGFQLQKLASMLSFIRSHNPPMVAGVAKADVGSNRMFFVPSGKVS